jgi:hypothetical protein
MVVSSGEIGDAFEEVSDKYGSDLRGLTLFFWRKTGPLLPGTMRHCERHRRTHGTHSC